MTEPKCPSPEEYIEQWEGMQGEFVKEGTEFRLEIPDLETTRKLRNDDTKPTLR